MSSAEWILGALCENFVVMIFPWLVVVDLGKEHYFVYFYLSANSKETKNVALSLYCATSDYNNISEWPMRLKLGGSDSKKTKVKNKLTQNI